MGKTANTKPTGKRNYDSTHIVVLGASAGGLKSIEQFLKALPDHLDLSIIIIQHLDPKKESQMQEIIDRYTGMQVQMISDSTPVQNRVVYLNPPGNYVFIKDKTLYLQSYDQGKIIHHPIDFFLRSLSADYGSMAVAVILSGSGSDGSLGIREIKANHGFVMAQEPSESQFDEMPRQAINTGTVDYVGPVIELTQKLDSIIKFPYGSFYEDSSDKIVANPKDLNRIFNEIYRVTGNDFSGYKTSTILRRLERKMAMLRINNLSDYADHLRKQKEESFALSQDLLISVTSFFREPAAFEEVKQALLTSFNSGQTRKKEFRAWIPACSTGEEAYSIGIILTELFNEIGLRSEIQVFASDISEESIESARRGLYPLNIENDIPIDLINKYFIKEEGQFRISKEIRNNIVFAKHDVLRDAPFSSMDLVSCRNILIYLNNDLQKHLLDVLSYSLMPGGILFLGSSERLGEAEYLYETLDEKLRIYKRLAIAKENTYMPLGRQERLKKEYRSGELAGKKDSNLEVINQMDKILLDEFSLPCVIVNSAKKAIYFRGRTEDYLKPPEGMADFSILKMIHEDYRFIFTKGLNKVIKEGKNFEKEGVSISMRDRHLKFDLIIRPLTNIQPNETYFLVMFREARIKTKSITPRKKPDKSSDQLVNALQDEIQQLKNQLRSSFNEHQDYNEHLQSLNEELSAKNEELQSSNEELETSKEELKSTNEEMMVINSELKEKLTELNRMQSDINNLLISTNIATLFLDQQMRIMRYTPQTLKLFNLLPNDLGRPITDIKSRLDIEKIIKHGEKVLQTLEHHKSEYQDGEGNWFDIKIMPYRSVENIIQGLVITFADSTRSRVLSRLETVINDSWDAITVQDHKGNLIAWNKGAEQIYGYSEKQALQLNVSQLIPKKHLTEYRDYISQIGNLDINRTLITKRKTKDGKELEVEIRVSVLHTDGPILKEFATTERIHYGAREGLSK